LRLSRVCAWVKKTMPFSDTPAELLKRLVDAPDHPYPREIVQEMIDRHEEITPFLLEVLEDAIQRPKHYLKGGNWKLVTFSSYLLAQFRVTAAFKPLCALLAGPEETTDELFGDMITEDMGNILASVFDGDDAPLRALVESRKVYEFVRGSTATKCYQCLLAAGRISLEALEAYATELLSSRLKREPCVVWDCWTELCADLGFASTVPLIEKAIDDNLCDPWYYGFDELLKAAGSGGNESWKESAGLIGDTIQETSWWATWEKSEGQEDEEDEDKLEDWESALLDDYVPETTTVVRTTPKVGRNDPCPCGSGKKFKKCCGVV
jgi:hypothetical protein